MDTPAETQSSPYKKQYIVYVLLALVFFVLGFVINAFGPKLHIGSSSKSSTIDLNKFWQVNTILQGKFDGDITADKQAQGAIAGMVASLGDPYTTYLTQEENQDLSDQLSGKLSGIGIEIGRKNDKLVVIAPIDATPAAKAGLRSGDVILAVDGADASSMTIEDAVKKIRGEKGTSVKLLIARGTESPQEITITRDDITVPSVTSELKNGNIGYIKIRTFGQNTANDVSTAAQNLVNQGAKAIILDVRDNPGGYLDAAVKISSNFIQNGTVVTEKSRHGEDKTFNASGNGAFTNIPVVVLVNNGSASASEILAGALHDNNRAVLVGEKTYGKGSVQEVVCLGKESLLGACSGDALKVTVAHWFTPKGVNISKEGISPDQNVAFTTQDYNAGLDPQLQKALEVATQKIGS